MNSQTLRGWFTGNRIVLAAVVSLGLAGCASEPPPAPETGEVKAELADAVAADRPITDAEVLEAAIDAGYQLQYRDGEKVYCRREEIFGTRVRERIVCLTADQIRTLSNDARDYMDDVTRRQLPKTGS